MCAGYTTPNGWAEIRIVSRLPELPPMLPRRWNIHPFDRVPILRERADGLLEVAEVQWWLVPSWAKEPRTRFATFNARVETIETKPSFREAFRRRRCLIPLDGFFERVEVPGEKKARPWYTRRRDGRPFLAAGIWERRESPEGVLESMAMVTVPANRLLEGIGHDRMPAIVPDDAQDFWLDHDEDRPDLLKGLLGPWPSGELETWPVGYDVNRRTSDGPGVLAPVGETVRVEGEG